MTDLIAWALRNVIDTRAMVIGEGAMEQAGEVFTKLFGTTRAVVVVNERTFALAGKQASEGLAAAGVGLTDPYVFPGKPGLYAKYENCEALRDTLAPMDTTTVAASSGTLNDITRQTSRELNRPYTVVDTTASMNGYTAFGPSIVLDGLKQTLSCPAPCGYVADLTVIPTAPQVMTASGYGGLLGRVPAGTDWILSGVLGIEAIDQGVWELVQGPLRDAVSRPIELAVGDVSAMGELVERLLMSRLAIQAHQSNHPTFGAEHQFNYLWEMEGHGVDTTPRRLSHSFKVGVSTAVIAALYERLPAQDLTGLDIDAAVTTQPTREKMEAGVRELHPDPRLIEETVMQTLAKQLPPEQSRVRLELPVAVWPELSVRLREQLLPATELQGMLRTAGAPTHPQDVRLGWDQFRETYIRAQMIRKCYTVLDLTLETNLLGELIEELFASDGFQGHRAPEH